mmetsp:Transcript_5722/g.14579  ORF Transcript_5722/g.14579 Transcript_5722/m.14579 type:complete len:230 (-) Transcript_5722:198-887(-)
MAPKALSTVSHGCSVADGDCSRCTCGELLRARDGCDVCDRSGLASSDEPPSPSAQVEIGVEPFRLARGVRAVAGASALAPTCCDSDRCGCLRSPAVRTLVVWSAGFALSLATAREPRAGTALSEKSSRSPERDSGRSAPPGTMPRFAAPAPPPPPRKGVLLPPVPRLLPVEKRVLARRPPSSDRGDIGHCLSAVSLGAMPRSGCRAGGEPSVEGPRLLLHTDVVSEFAC